MVLHRLRGRGALNVGRGRCARRCILVRVNIVFLFHAFVFHVVNVISVVGAIVIEWCLYPVFGGM
jgi:hypothetical protein